MEYSFRDGQEFYPGALERDEGRKCHERGQRGHKTKVAQVDGLAMKESRHRRKGKESSRTVLCSRNMM